MHTNFSDGRWPAQQLIDYLANEGFDLVSVTDHDRVDTIAGIQELAAGKILPVLAGVEMSTDWNGKMGHMLCYGFDPEDNFLRDITAADNGRLLREHGYVADWQTSLRMIREAGFRTIMADMAQTVEAAHRSGAVCLIAHPGRREQNFTFYDADLLDQLRAEIPIDGIEVYHPYHSPEIVKTYLEYVHKHHLLLSTGSDSHSIPGRMPVKHRAEISQRLLERVGVQVK